MLALACMASALFAMTAMADGDMGGYINSVSLSISSNIQAGSDDCDVSADVTSYNCEVTDVEVLNVPDDEWQGGQRPRVQITVEADDEYIFAAQSSGTIHLSGAGAEYVSSSISGDQSTLNVTVRLRALQGDYSDDVYDVCWRDDSSLVATWEDDDDNGHYEVHLIHDGSGNDYQSVKTNNKHYNFGNQIRSTGTFTFRVRVYYNDNEKGDWQESDEIDVDEDLLNQIKRDFGESSGGPDYQGAEPGPSGGPGAAPTPSSGPSVSPGWKQDSKGWWYVESNGSYPTSSWLQVNGKWYYFDSQGYMKTGWIHDSNNGNWYYCGSDGAMETNSWTPDGYYVDANGVWEE